VSQQLGVGCAECRLLIEAAFFYVNRKRKVLSNEKHGENYSVRHNGGLPTGVGNNVNNEQNNADGVRVE